MKQITAAELEFAPAKGRALADGGFYNQAAVVRCVCSQAGTTVPARGSVRWEQICAAASKAAREVRDAERKERHVLADLERAFHA